MRMKNFCNFCNQLLSRHIGNLDFLVFFALVINKRKILGYSRTEFETRYKSYKINQGYRK